MPAEILDGKAIAKQLKTTIANEVAVLQAQHNILPKLATILVGDDASSASYVRMKHRAAKKAGMLVVGEQLSAETQQPDLLTLIRQYNQDESIDGILVQLPLPDHLDEQAAIDAVAAHKDVDGLGVTNMGLLMLRGRTPHFVPPTPAGVMHLLTKTGVEIAGKRAVVVGRSNLVGLPTALLLQEANATVTLCHSYSTELAEIVGSADIVVAAAGVVELISAEMLKPNAIVIDVAINSIDDPTAKRGYRLLGDVDFATAQEKVGWITPVPGGVGPMTIAMLLQNTLIAAQRRVTK